MPGFNKPKSTRLPMMVVELILLMSAIAMLWWQPLGDSLSVVLGSGLIIVFIGFLPVLLQGERAVKRENDLLKREFTRHDERNKP